MSYLDDHGEAAESVEEIRQQLQRILDERVAELDGTHFDFVTSEIVRYLGHPGQAISYKVGERAWLAGREAARAAHGEAFDLKSCHMAALSLGALGLDDLTTELALL